MCSYRFRSVKYEKNIRKMSTLGKVTEKNLKKTNLSNPQIYKILMSRKIYVKTMCSYRFRSVKQEKIIRNIATIRS